MRSLHTVVLVLSLAAPAFGCAELQGVAAADLATPVPNEPTDERSCESVQVDIGGRTLVGVAFLDAQGPGFAIVETATEPRVIFATRESGMPPVNPQVRAQDLTGDGIPEFVAAFMSASSVVSEYVFAIEGDRVVHLTGALPGGFSGVPAPTYVDIDGDRRLEAISCEGGDVVPADPDNDGGEKITEPVRCSVRKLVAPPAVDDLLFYGTFVRSKEAPVTTKVEFVAPAVGDRQLIVVNGAHPLTGASAAVVRLNGGEVIGASALSENRTFVTRVVQLTERNLLEVELRGKPGDAIQILVK